MKISGLHLQKASVLVETIP